VVRRLPVPTPIQVRAPGGPPHPSSGSFVRRGGAAYPKASMKTDRAATRKPRERRRGADGSVMFSDLACPRFSDPRIRCVLRFGSGWMLIGMAFDEKESQRHRQPFVWNDHRGLSRTWLGRGISFFVNVNLRGQGGANSGAFLNAGGGKHRQECLCYTPPRHLSHRHSCLCILSRGKEGSLATLVIHASVSRGNLGGGVAAHPANDNETPPPNASRSLDSRSGMGRWSNARPHMTTTCSAR